MLKFDSIFLKVSFKYFGCAYDGLIIPLLTLKN